MNRRAWMIVAAVLIVVVGLVVRNQIKVYSNRASRAAEQRARETKGVSVAQSLFEALQPVALANCELVRFGEAHDGGYLMCANLLADVQSGYSYGIAGYDKWGCDMSTTLQVRVHQYDCFDTTQPACPGGDTVFHAECIADRTKVENGREFDTFLNQFARNGDAGKRLVMKIDVEGAEWDAFLHAPEEVLDQLEQIAVEFHWAHDEKYLQVVERLKKHFHVAHLHVNNFSCIDHLAPFTGWAYEVLFVHKRVGVQDPSGAAGGIHPLDAPNNPDAPDCQMAPL
ncbi:MAG TPA: hypothetical protein VMO26_13565 [Vicinamibacterales bacterium]|nr:hypothetical protein [Vicinamibacterales bacterium]